MQGAVHIAAQGARVHDFTTGLAIGRIQIQKRLLVPRGQSLDAGAFGSATAEDHGLVAVPSSGHVAPGCVQAYTLHAEAIHAVGEFLCEVTDIAVQWLPLWLHHGQVTVHPFLCFSILGITLQRLGIIVQFAGLPVQELHHLGIPDLSVFRVAQFHVAIRETLRNMLIHCAQVRSQFVFPGRWSIRHLLVVPIGNARMCLRTSTALCPRAKSQRKCQKHQRISQTIHHQK